MKEEQWKPTQEVTDDVLRHIGALTADDGGRLQRACSRYRRRARVLHSTVALAVVVAIGWGTASAQAARPYDDMTVSGQIDAAQVCAGIDEMVENL